MKYVYSCLILLVFLLVVVNVTNFSYEQEVETYDMVSNEIDTIEINVNDVNVNVSSSLDKDIRIEHIFSPDQNLSSNIYSYVEGNVLYIKQYPYENNVLITKREDINVYLPSAYDFKNLSINTTSGAISIDNLNLQNIDVYSETGQFNVATIVTDQLNLKGTNIGVNISDLEATTLNILLEEASVYIGNSFVDSTNISVAQKGSISIGKLVSDSIVIDALLSEVQLQWTTGFNYSVTTTNEVKNDQLTTTTDGYEYNKNEGVSTIVYTINSKKLDITLSESTEA